VGLRIISAQLHCILCSTITRRNRLQLKVGRTDAVCNVSRQSTSVYSSVSGCWPSCYSGQTAGCIKMLLAMEVGLSPGDFVLDGDPAPPQKGSEPPIFGPRLLWPNSCMDQDATWCGGRPWSRRHCVRWGPSPPPVKGHSPQFSVNARCG